MQGIPAQFRAHVLGCSPTLYLQLQKMISCPMSFCTLSGLQYFFLGMMEVWVTNGADLLNFSDVIFLLMSDRGKQSSGLWASGCPLLLVGLELCPQA